MHLSAPTEANRAHAIGWALRTELGGSRAMVNAIGRWTSTSDRAIKNWMGGKSVPSSLHLVGLMRHSRVVLSVVLAAAGRSTGREE